MGRRPPRDWRPLLGEVLDPPLLNLARLNGTTSSTPQKAKKVLVGTRKINPPLTNVNCCIIIGSFKSPPTSKTHWTNFFHLFEVSPRSKYIVLFLLLRRLSSDYCNNASLTVIRTGCQCVGKLWFRSQSSMSARVPQIPSS